MDDACALAKMALRRDEGYRRHPYRCTAGHLTVGYGRNLDDKGITETEAQHLLEADIVIAQSLLATEDYWSDLDCVRQSVLINMVVNLGWSGFKGFRRLRAAVRAHQYSRAADEIMDSQAAKQTGERYHRLAQSMRDGLVYLGGRAHV